MGIKCNYVAENKHHISLKTPYDNTRWWQHHGVRGFFFISGNKEASDVFVEDGGS